MTALVLQHTPRGKRARGPSDAAMLTRIIVANIILATIVVAIVKFWP